MKYDIEDLIDKVRIAIDDIKLDSDDTFYANADTEIRQALVMAARQILDEADVHMLEPTVIAGPILEGAVFGHTDGSGIIALPDDFLKLQELKFRSWAVGVSEVADPGSEVANRQASTWSQGSAHKPVLVKAFDARGNKILKYWKVGLRYVDDAEPPVEMYDHMLEYLNYIPQPEISEGDNKITIAVKDEAERYIIYRAAGIFLEGKKEDALAERMYNLSKM